jgi:hypothetical protein
VAPALVAEIVALHERWRQERASEAVTLEGLAAGISPRDLAIVIGTLRRALRSLVVTAPETAFVPRPGADGTEGWCAGQLVDHVCSAQSNVHGRFLRTLVALSSGATSAHPIAPDEPRPLDRAAALATLDAAQHDLEALMAATSADIDERARIATRSFGPLGVRGALLFFAIHEFDHLEQLQATW